MKKEIHQFSYEVYTSAAELLPADAALLNKAKEATAHSHAPYSRFRVGAAALLANGEIVTGANQENASFPAGICAERTLMSVAAMLFPGVAIDTMAVSYYNEQGSSETPISPCGICRQSFQEFAQRTGSEIRLVLGGYSGPVYIIAQSSSLLPMAFSKKELE